jgi:flagellar hook assembly protein FlgD
MQEHKNAGLYSLQWNGTNNAGTLVGSGMYFLRIKKNNEVLTIKLLVLK